jgi:hypothetical protein
VKARPDPLLAKHGVDPGLSRKKTVLDSRQFIGLLLPAFSVAALVIAVAIGVRPAEGSIEGMLSLWRAESNMVETLGFLLPPLQSFIVPLLAVTPALAAVNFGRP